MPDVYTRSIAQIGEASQSSWRMIFYLQITGNDGTEEERLARFREVQDLIELRTKEWVKAIVTFITGFS